MTPNDITRLCVCAWL